MAVRCRAPAPRPGCCGPPSSRAAGGLVALLGYVPCVPILERLRGAPTPAYLNVHGPSTMPGGRRRRRRHGGSPSPWTSPPPTARCSPTRSAWPRPAAGAHGSRLLHVVESGGARLMGGELQDSEARADQARLELYVDELRRARRRGRLRPRLRRARPASSPASSSVRPRPRGPGQPRPRRRSPTSCSAPRSSGCATASRVPVLVVPVEGGR